MTDNDQEINVNEDETFLYYEPKAYNPGWQMTWIVIVACVIVNLSLPLLLARWRRRNRKHRIPPPKVETPVEEENDDESVLSSIISKTMETRSSRARHRPSSSHARKKRRPNRARRLQEDDDISFASSLVLNPSLMKGDHPTSKASDFQEASIVFTNTSTLDQFISISEWDSEARKLVSLWIPYSISGAAEGISQTIIIGIISHYIGSKEANAYVVVTIMMEFADTLTYGFAEGKSSVYI
jgi:hypothetical protein